MGEFLMFYYFKKTTTTFAFLSLAICYTSLAQAVQFTFTLDPSQSSISLQALLNGIPLLEQLPGSGTASYSGTVVVSVDNPLAPTWLSLDGGGLASAAEYTLPLLPGPGATAFDPGTPTSAVYGIKATSDGTPGGSPLVYGSLHDVAFDVTSKGVPVDGLGNFPSKAPIFNAVSAEFVAWQAGEGIIFNGDLSGQSFTNDDFSPNSSYVVSGSKAILTIVVNSHAPAPDGPWEDWYEGVLVGTATVVPESSAFILCLGGFAGICFLTRRNKFSC
jgi:hypothetical protein